MCSLYGKEPLFLTGDGTAYILLPLLALSLSTTSSLCALGPDYIETSKGWGTCTKLSR